MILSFATWLPAALLLPAVQAERRGPITVEAGPNLTATVGEEIELQGEVRGLAPIRFWVGDGNLETEDKLITYDEQEGFGVIGPLRSHVGTIYGWPSDLVRIDGVVYGLETQHSRLYVLEAATATCRPLGGDTGYEWMTCLAYDHVEDVLYAVDARSDQLLVMNRLNGKAQPVGERLPFDRIKGIAYHERSGLLFGYDDGTKSLITIKTGPVVEAKSYLKLSLPQKVYFDELAFHAGELYGTLVYPNGTGGKDTQVQHIDLYTGEATNVGPPILDATSHSLLIESMPERIQWSQVEGPGRARFRNRSQATTPVRFSQPGTYLLELGMPGRSKKYADRVTVEVSE